MEVPPEVSPSQPQLPAASPQLGTSTSDYGQGIWEIFREHEGKIWQEISDLKAKDKKDYIIRLLHLYLYARSQISEDRVPRANIYKFLEDAGVKGSNTSRYIGRLHSILAEENHLRLNQAGRNKAQQYIVDALNADLPEGWYPGSAAQPVKSRMKRLSKRRIEKQNRSNSRLTDLMSKELLIRQIKAIALFDSSNRLLGNKDFMQHALVSFCD